MVVIVDVAGAVQASEEHQSLDSSLYLDYEVLAKGKTYLPNAVRFQGERLPTPKEVRAQAALQLPAHN